MLASGARPEASWASTWEGKLYRKWRRAVANWSPKDELVPTCVSHCLHAPDIGTDGQKSWHLSPSMELPMNLTRDPEKQKKGIWEKLKELRASWAPHQQHQPAGPFL